MNKIIVPDEFVHEVWPLSGIFCDEIQYYLCGDIQDWFKERGIDYFFSHERITDRGFRIVQCFVRIESAVDALQFKLSFDL